MPHETPWLTIPEARTIARCGAKLLYAEIAAGRLRAARIGGKRAIRVHIDWLNDWLVAASTPVPVLVRRSERVS